MNDEQQEHKDRLIDTMAHVAAAGRRERSKLNPDEKLAQRQEAWDGLRERIGPRVTEIYGPRPETMEQAYDLLATAYDLLRAQTQAELGLLEATVENSVLQAGALVEPSFNGPIENRAIEFANAVQPHLEALERFGFAAIPRAKVRELRAVAEKTQAAQDTLRQAPGGVQ